MRRDSFLGWAGLGLNRSPTIKACHQFVFERFYGWTLGRPYVRWTAADEARAAALLAYPDIDWEQLETVWSELSTIRPDIREQIEIDALYSGYMARHDADIAAFRKDEALQLPENLDYSEIGSLSNEVRQKLETARPATLGAASRIPGVTPAAVVALLRHVKKSSKKNAA